MAGWIEPDFPGPSAFAVARYQDNGKLDPVFGNGVGYVTTEFATESDDRANALVKQHDGKIVVAGYHDPVGDVPVFALARYLDDGNLDTSFGSNGVVTTDFGDSVIAYATGVGVQADGRIVSPANPAGTPVGSSS